MPKSVLAVVLDARRVAMDEYNDWYDLEHIPDRQRIHGFDLCARWVDVDDPNRTATIYDLASLSVLSAPAYQAITGVHASPWSQRMLKSVEVSAFFQGSNLQPAAGETPQDADGLLITGMNIDPAHEDEFNQWYDQEHIPALLDIDGTRAAFRFASSDSPTKYLTLYYVGSPEVVLSDAWSRAVGTPWTAKILPRVRDRFRILTRRYRREDRNL